MSRKKFTRILKIPDLLAAGAPVETIPTYCALADHANNKTGLCWPKMASLAATLGVSVRTIQRHLTALSAAGLIKFVQRRRVRGRYSSYLYRVLHYTNIATGHGRPVVRPVPNKERTKPPLNSQNSQEKREKEAKRRSEGFEWFFR